MYLAAIIIYYLSYLLFPILVWGLFKTYKSKKLQYLVFSLFILLGIYSRFIEPQLIQVKATKIDLPQLEEPIQIALIADPQFGVYKKQNFATRLVDKINTLDPDYVFIAGDITYKAKPYQLTKLLAPLANLKNVYAVLGNHDYFHTGVPSDELSQSLTQELQALNIPIIDNQIIETPQFNLLGYGSIWAKNFNPPQLSSDKTTKLSLNLMHNPDGTYEKLSQNTLTFAGHTHCGQIQIPILYKWALPTDNYFSEGLQESPSGPLFVSCGLGESMLPLRLFNPPRIDLITLY